MAGASFWQASWLPGSGILVIIIAFAFAFASGVTIRQ